MPSTVLDQLHRIILHSARARLSMSPAFRFFPVIPVLAALLMSACAGGARTAQPEEEPPARAPWQDSLLSAGEIPSVYVVEWQRAENRATCALIAPEMLHAPEEASPRRAQFGGGWAVAYDLPDLRSAFGVAGTGVSVGGASYSEWPHRIEWPDGSVAEYGPEGGTGPNELAYLRIQGQDCLYNVWSRLGRSHLEDLLLALRYVDVDD